MTKADVIAEVSQKTGLEKIDVQRTIEQFVEVIKGSLINNENVYMRGFGSFTTKKRAEKVARNITKNTSITVPEHYIPNFKPAKTFVAEVKDNVKSKKA